MKMSPVPYRSVGIAAAYSVSVTGALYWDSLAGHSESRQLSILGGVLLLSLLAGAAVERWWAVLLPFVPALLALPLEIFPTPSATVGELPLYGVPAAAIGVGVRRAAKEWIRVPRISWWAVGLVAVYTACVSAVMVYAASLDGNDEFATSIVITFFAAHALVGFALGRWRALLLVLLLPILAVPVPVPEDAYESLPLWYAMLIWVGPLAALTMAVGIGLRNTTARLREAPRA